MNDLIIYNSKTGEISEKDIELINLFNKKVINNLNSYIFSKTGINIKENSNIEEIKKVLKENDLKVDIFCEEKENFKIFQFHLSIFKYKK